jgi:hypothetical protein
VQRIVRQRYGKEIGPIAYRTYLALCSFANDERRCWPSYTKIAEEAMFSRLSAMRGVRTLREFGIIWVITDYRRGKLPRNVYTLLDLDAPLPADLFAPGSPQPLAPDWWPTEEEQVWARELGNSQREIEDASRRFVRRYTTERRRFCLFDDEWAVRWGNALPHPPP